MMVEPANGRFELDERYTDVALGWFQYVYGLAAIRGNARVVVFMGHQWIADMMTEDFEPFRNNCRNWMRNGSATANFVNVTENFQAGDILLITREDRFDVENVFNKLKSGENSALIGFPARDSTDSASQLLEKLEVVFVKIDYEFKPTYARFGGLIYSDDFIPLSYRLQQLIDSWASFSHIKYEYYGQKQSETVWDAPFYQLLVKRLAEKYLPVMYQYGPCPHNKYTKRIETEIALLNYNYILRYQFAEKCQKLPHVQNYLGVKRLYGKPTTIVVNIYADLQSDFFPTGGYAEPGEGFTYTVLSNSDKNYRKQRIRVNAQTDWIGYHDPWVRWPTVASDYRLKQHGIICSPHGGPIFLQLPKGTNITIRLENVYRYAWLDVRNPKSVDKFEEEIRTYIATPWIILNGDSMTSIIRFVDLYNSNASEAISSVRHFDKAIKVMHNYRGSLWETSRLEFFVSDLDIAIGAGHAGYPWMGSLDWSRLFLLYSKSIRKGGQPGFVHEIGHNLQVYEATLKNGDEVTNNIFRLIVDEIVLGLNPYKGDKDTGKWNSDTYSGFGWGYYRYLGYLFGYGLVGNGFIEAIKAGPGGEYRKTQFWLQQMCKETKYDLLPFHEMWHVPVSDETRNVCGAYECFFPDDEWTKPHQAKVDKVLKKYGKPCNRTDPRQVPFRGHIGRGMDNIRPQNIFVTFG